MASHRVAWLSSATLPYRHRVVEGADASREAARRTVLKEKQRIVLKDPDRPGDDTILKYSVPSAVFLHGIVVNTLPV